MNNAFTLNYLFTADSPGRAHLQALNDLWAASPNPLGIRQVQGDEDYSVRLRVCATSEIGITEFRLDSPADSDTHFFFERSRSHISQNHFLEYGIIVFDYGSNEIATCGDAHSMRTGDFIVTNNETPLQAHIHNQVNSYNFSLPASWDRIGDTKLEDVFGRFFRRGDYHRNGLITFASGLLNRPQALTRAATTEKLYDVLALALNPRAVSEHQAGLLELIRNFIDSHFADSELNPAKVAAAFGISVRYLHQLFAKSDAAFTDYLVAVRLEQASRILSEASFQHRTILGVAYDCGFRDINHFGRRFKQRYGSTPGELRRSATIG